MKDSFNRFTGKRNPSAERVQPAPKAQGPRPTSYTALPSSQALLSPALSQGENARGTTPLSPLHPSFFLSAPLGLPAHNLISPQTSHTVWSKPSLHPLLLECSHPGIFTPVGPNCYIEYFKCSNFCQGHRGSGESQSRLDCWQP